MWISKQTIQSWYCFLCHGTAAHPPYVGVHITFAMKNHFKALIMAHHA